jgi:predicted MPP superfamily phosphohydrolase
MRKIVAFISISVALVFSAIALLTYPIWMDIRAYLGMNLPLMAILAGLGIVFGAYAFFLLRSRFHWVHFIILGLVDAGMIVLLVVLFKELGTESVIIARTAAFWLPIAAGFAVVASLIWFYPRWKFMENKIVRNMLTLGILIAAILWVSLPLRVQMVIQPVVFLHQDGVMVAWETNMESAGSLTYGAQPATDQRVVSQTSGLLDLGDHVQSVFIPSEPTTANLYFRAASEGIRSLKLATGIHAGQVESELSQVRFPPADKELSIVAFSDLHEHNGLYDKIAENIQWTDIDEAIFIGDLVTNAANPSQVAHNILDLPAGEGSIPRVLVRGNHETRGDAARLLSDWLLPPGGKWYFTFSSGNVFFVVLDSGEDKADSDPSYAGLNDFADYHLQQAAWLSAVFSSPEYQEAAYRVLLVHIPPFIKMDQDRFGEISPDFAPVMELLNNQADIDLMMSGHIHEGAIWLPDETGVPYPVTTCGGQYANDMAAVTAQFGGSGIDLKVLNINGDIVDQAFIPRK